MFQGRAGHLGGDADLGEEMLLVGVELVVGAALDAQPARSGVVEGAEAAL
jgi:hypothetical protein